MAERETVVVTGASAGVGRAIVREFAKRQANVGLLARSDDGLDAAKREVEQAGGRALALPTDVADHEAVAAAAATVEEELGPIDVWVNDAMTTVFAFFDDIEPDEFRRALEVTYLGAVWGTRAALDRMLPRDRGTVVLVGSALAYRGIPLQSAYCGEGAADGGPGPGALRQPVRPGAPRRGRPRPLRREVPRSQPPALGDHAPALACHRRLGRHRAPSSRSLLPQIANIEGTRGH